MTQTQLAQIINEKVNEALNLIKHPKNFFITENGRGVVDGRELYNAILKDVSSVMKVAIFNILKALLVSKNQQDSNK